MEIFDDDLSPELAAKKKKNQIIDHNVLRRFIETNFPIYKTATILKIAELWKSLPEHEAEYNYYANRVSNEDLSLLFEGMQASIVNKKWLWEDLLLFPAFDDGKRRFIHLQNG